MVKIIPRRTPVTPAPPPVPVGSRKTTVIAYRPKAGKPKLIPPPRRGPAGKK